MIDLLIELMNLSHFEMRLCVKILPANFKKKATLLTDFVLQDGRDSQCELGDWTLVYSIAVRKLMTSLKSISEINHLPNDFWTWNMISIGCID